MKKGNRENPMKEFGDRGKKPFPEDCFFQKIDTELGAEDAYKLISEKEDGKKDRDPPERVDHQVSKGDGKSYWKPFCRFHHLREDLLDLPETDLIDQIT